MFQTGFVPQKGDDIYETPTRQRLDLVYLINTALLNISPFTRQRLVGWLVDMLKEPS